MFKTYQRGKDHRNSFVFLSRCILHAFQSRLSISFDRGNSSSCWGQCCHRVQLVDGVGSAPETTEHCHLNLGSRLHITDNILGGRQGFPSSHSGPRLPLQACKSWRQHLVTKWRFLVRSQDKEGGVMPKKPDPNHHWNPLTVPRARAILVAFPHHSCDWVI